MEVEILGHKAKIDRVSAQAKQEPWHKEDQLVVWLEFDESVDGVVSFAVLLPVKKYEREEFLKEVSRHGDAGLERILVRHGVEKREREARSAHKIALDLMAEQAQKLIE